VNWFSFFRKNNIPEDFKWYKDALEQNKNKNVLLKNIRFVVLDTETTGLDPAKDRILAIGGVGVKGYQIDLADSFEVYLKQELVGVDSIPVHEITPHSSATGLHPKAALSQFLKWVEGSIIIGHYVDFDYRILSQASERNLGFKLENKRYDTMRMLKRVDNHFANEALNKPEDWGLDQLCERYNLPISDRLTAPGDALGTAQLFVRLLKKLEHRGVKTVGDLFAR
jgi:DNA polymerase-3 subunit epsilon